MQVQSAGPYLASTAAVGAASVWPLSKKSYVWGTVGIHILLVSCTKYCSIERKAAFPILSLNHFSGHTAEGDSYVDFKSPYLQ